MQFPTRANPISLLQPQPHLEQLFPRRADTSPRLAHTMPKVTYVGSIGDSLYALGNHNFPLVVFDQTPPLSIPEGDSVNNPPCNGIECLVGARRMDAISQYYPPQLIDPPTPSKSTDPTDSGRQLPVEHTSIGLGPPKLETEINQSIFPISDPPHLGWEIDIRTWGILGFTLLLGMTIAKVFMNNPRETTSSTINASSVEPDQDPIPDPPPSIPAVLSEAVPPAISAEPDKPLPPSLDIPVLAAPPTSASPLQNSPEAALDAEDNDDTDKEGEVGQTRRKGPRRRRRGKKKKAEQVVDNPEAGESAELDDYVRVQLPNGNPLSPATPVLSPLPLVTPSTPLPILTSSALPPKVDLAIPSSLIVSETVLGKFLLNSFTPPYFLTFYFHRLWFPWNCSFRRLPARPGGSSQTSTTRLCYCSHP